RPGWSGWPVARAACPGGTDRGHDGATLAAGRLLARLEDREQLGRPVAVPHLLGDPAPRLRPHPGGDVLRRLRGPAGAAARLLRRRQRLLAAGPGRPPGPGDRGARGPGALAHDPVRL